MRNDAALLFGRVAKTTSCTTCFSIQDKMRYSKSTEPVAGASAPLYIVKNSRVHGRGVFAARKLPADTCIIEYRGQRIDADTANDRGSSDPDNPFHTFFF